MQKTPKIVLLLLLMLGTVGAMYAEIADPLPEHVEKRGLAVQIKDVVRLPDTRGLRPADQDVGRRNSERGVRLQADQSG